jgi:hypothetical protein
MNIFWPANVKGGEALGRPRSILKKRFRLILEK